MISSQYPTTKFNPSHPTFKKIQLFYNMKILLTPKLKKRTNISITYSADEEEN